MNQIPNEPVKDETPIIKELTKLEQEKQGVIARKKHADAIDNILLLTKVRAADEDLIRPWEIVDAISQAFKSLPYQPRIFSKKQNDTLVNETKQNGTNTGK